MYSCSAGDDLRPDYCELEPQRSEQGIQMRNRNNPILKAGLAAFVFFSAALHAQTANGTINATLVNKSGLTLVFDTAAGGVTLGSSGSPAASAGFGVISAFGPLSAGVTRPTVGPTTFTVQTQKYPQ